MVNMSHLVMEKGACYWLRSFWTVKMSDLVLVWSHRKLAAKPPKNFT